MRWGNRLLFGFACGFPIALAAVWLAMPRHDVLLGLGAAAAGGLVGAGAALLHT
jgi:hypothetical protein